MKKRAKIISSPLIKKLLGKVSKEMHIKNLGRKQISLQIKEVLNEKGWTQKKLAEKLGKSEAEISKWLSGKHNFTLDTIFSLQMILGADIILIPKFCDLGKEIFVFIERNFIERKQSDTMHISAPKEKIIKEDSFDFNLSLGYSPLKKGAMLN